MPFGYTPKTSFGKSMARKTWGYDDAYQPSDEVAKEGAANPDVADALDEDLKRTESSVAQEKAGFTGDDAQDDFKASVNLSAQVIEPVHHPPLTLSSHHIDLLTTDGGRGST